MLFEDKTDKTLGSNLIERDVIFEQAPNNRPGSCFFNALRCNHILLYCTVNVDVNKSYPGGSVKRLTSEFYRKLLYGAQYSDETVSESLLDNLVKQRKPTYRNMCERYNVST